MKNVLLVILGIAVTFATPAIASEGMVTLKWIDEEGQPLSGIQVQAGFEGATDEDGHKRALCPQRKNLLRGSRILREA